MIDRQFLDYLIPYIDGLDHVKVSRNIDFLLDAFGKSNQWQTDKLSLELYYKDVNKYLKTCRKRQYDFDYRAENELIIKAQKGDLKARQEVIHRNLGIVIHTARKYQGLGLSLNDLISEGNIGMMEAIDKHDVSRGFSFATYARFSIVGGIQNAINKYGSLIRYPATTMSAYRKIKKYIDRFMLEHGYPPLCEEIARGLKLEEDFVEAYYEKIPLSLNVEDIHGYINDFDLSDDFINAVTDKTLSTLEEMDIDGEFRNESLAIDINEALDQLYEHECKILKMYYGIGCREYALQEIAEEFSLSKERIRQIAGKAVRRLKGVKSKKLAAYLLAK